MSYLILTMGGDLPTELNKSFNCNFVFPFGFRCVEVLRHLCECVESVFWIVI
jgi:hypothetical protein